MTKDLRRGIAVACALLGFPLAAHAQTTITGRVTTNANTPLAGVIVGIPTLSAGATTNAEGRYTFVVGSDKAGQTAALTARRIGFQPKTVTIALTRGTMTQDFTLVETPTELTGVVVTALGTEKAQK